MNGLCGARAIQRERRCTAGAGCLLDFGGGDMHLDAAAVSGMVMMRVGGGDRMASQAGSDRGGMAIGMRGMLVRASVSFATPIRQGHRLSGEGAEPDQQGGGATYKCLPEIHR